MRTRKRVRLLGGLASRIVSTSARESFSGNSLSFQTQLIIQLLGPSLVSWHRKRYRVKAFLLQPYERTRQEQRVDSPTPILYRDYKYLNGADLCRPPSPLELHLERSRILGRG